MPGIDDRLVTSEAAGMLPDQPSVLAQLDAIGIGADSTGRPMALATIEYLFAAALRPSWLESSSRARNSGSFVVRSVKPIASR